MATDEPSLSGATRPFPSDDIHKPARRFVATAIPAAGVLTLGVSLTERNKGVR